METTDLMYFDYFTLSEVNGLDDDSINALKEIYIKTCAEWKEALEKIIDDLKNGYSESVYDEAEFLTHATRGTAAGVGDKMLSLASSYAYSSLRSLHHESALINMTSTLIRVKAALAKIK